MRKGTSGRRPRNWPPTRPSRGQKRPLSQSNENPRTALSTLLELTQVRAVWAVLLFTIFNLILQFLDVAFNKGYEFGISKPVIQDLDPSNLNFFGKVEAPIKGTET